MTTENDISVRLFATRAELDRAYISGGMVPGQIFALEGIDPDVLAYLIARPISLHIDDDGCDDIDWIDV